MAKKTLEVQKDKCSVVFTIGSESIRIGPSKINTLVNWLFNVHGYEWYRDVHEAMRNTVGNETTHQILNELNKYTVMRQTVSIEGKQNE